MVPGFVLAYLEVSLIYTIRVVLVEDFWGEAVNEEDLLSMELSLSVFVDRTAKVRPCEQLFSMSHIEHELRIKRGEVLAAIGFANSMSFLVGVEIAFIVTIGV